MSVRRSIPIWTWAAFGVAATIAGVVIWLAVSVQGPLERVRLNARELGQLQAFRIQIAEALDRESLRAVIDERLEEGLARDDDIGRSIASVAEIASSVCATDGLLTDSDRARMYAAIDGAVGVTRTEQGQLSYSLRATLQLLAKLGILASLGCLVLCPLLVLSHLKSRRIAQMERDVRVANTSLEEHVAERTSELESVNTSLRRQFKERVWAEEALRESEDRVRLLLDSTAEAIFGIDLNGTCTFVNRSCLDMLGYKRPSQLLGRPMTLILDDPNNPPWNDFGESGETICARELVLRRLDKASFQAELWAHRIRRSDRIVGTVVTFLDVTEQLRSRHAQRDALDKFQRIAASVPDAFYSTRVNPDGGFSVEYVSPGFARMWGFEASALYENARLWMRSILDDDLPGVERAVNAVVTTKQPRVARYQIRGTDGRLRSIEDTMTPITGPDGRVHRIDGIARDISERISVEDQLVESQRALSTLMANLPGMAYRCENDQDWTMTFVSDGCSTLTGYRSADLINNRIVSYNDLIIEDDQDRIWDEVQQALANRNPFELEYRIRRADGSVRWVWEQGRGVFDTFGELRCLEGFITDVNEAAVAREAIESARQDLEHRVHERTSELLDANRALQQEVETRKRAEEELLASELRFQDLFENANDLIFAFRPDGSFVYVNQAWRQALGYDEADLASLNAFSIIHPDYTAVAENQFKLFLEGQSTTIDECAFITKTGATIYVEGSATTRMDGARPVLIRVIVRNITAKYETEQQLRESERRFRLLVEHAGDAFFLHDENQRILDVNQQACSSLGYAREELLNMAVSDIDLAWPSDRSKRLIVNMREGEPVTVEGMQIRKDGSAFPVEVRVGLLREQGQNFYLGLARDITQRKLAEAELRKTRERLVQLIDTCPAVIYTSPPNGVDGPDFVSENVEAVTGFTASEVTSDPSLLLDRIHPADRNDVLRGICPPWPSDRRVLEYRLLNRNGEYIWARNHMNVIRDVSNEPIEVVGFLTDITDRKLIEDRLRKSEVRYRGIVEDQTELISRFNPNFFITFANDSYCRYFMLDRSDVLNRSVFELMPSEMRDTIREYFRALTIDNPVDSIEHAVKLPSGETRWQLWTDRAIFDEQGTLIEYQSVGHDITDRKVAEKAAAERENQLVLVTNALPMLVSHIDANQRYLFSNVAHKAWFGLNPDELRGKHVQETLGAAYDQALHAVELALSGTSTSLEIQLQRVDGGTRYVQADLLPDVRPDGGFFMVGTDITEMKERAEAARQRIEESAHANRLYTLGELAAGLAHELNQPLGAISAYARACQEMSRKASGHSENGGNGEHQEAQLELIDKMRFQAQRGGQIIRRLQRFIRKQEPSRGPTKLIDIVSEAIALAEVDLRANQVDLQLDIGPDLPPIHADAIQIQQVLLNLMSNACDAMTAARSPERKIRVEGSTRSDGSFVEVRVSDTGPGFDRELLDRIFDPFVTGRTEGMGLGLSICESLVEDHGGRVWIESEFGHGATVAFTVPVYREGLENGR